MGKTVLTPLTFVAAGLNHYTPGWRGGRAEGRGDREGQMLHSLDCIPIRIVRVIFQEASPGCGQTISLQCTLCRVVCVQHSSDIAH